MPRGPKPKTRQERLANGAREDNLPEPVLLRGRLGGEPPDHLDDEAKGWWRHAVPILSEVGILEVVDQAALEMAATSYSRYRQARRVVEAQGMLARGSTGQLTAHPMLAEERNAQQMFLRFAEQYALTPVARTRLGLAELQRRSMAQEMDETIGVPKLRAV